MSVYGYIRLNTSVETPEGLGFKEQTQKINAWAEESKIEIKKIHRDKEPTSSSLDLPRLAKLTKQIDQGKVHGVGGGQTRPLDPQHPAL